MNGVDRQSGASSCRQIYSMTFKTPPLVHSFQYKGSYCCFVALAVGLHHINESIE